MHISTDSRTTPNTCRALSLIVALVLLAICTVHPASATIYQFAIPVSSIEALMPANSTAYDIYIRAATVGSECFPTCSFLPTPYNVNATPPTAAQAWTDVINGKNTNNDGIVGPGDTAPYQSIHFTFGASPTISVIVNNSNSPGSIVGNTVDNKTVGGVILNGSQFIVDIASATSGLAGNNYSLYIFGTADMFSAGYTGASTSKAANFHGSVLATAQLTPEPMSMFMGGGGILLFALVGVRRRRKTS